MAFREFVAVGVYMAKRFYGLPTSKHAGCTNMLATAMRLR